MGKSAWYEISKYDRLNFSAIDLKTVDRRWLKYSQGKWGFSVQKQIYVDCGARLDGEYPGDEVWREFCIQVGQRKPEGFRGYANLFFNLESSPEGESPGGSISICRGDYGLLVWGVVFSRVEACKISAQ
jgi:hypothetical protein